MTKISNVRRYYFSMSCEGKVLSMLIIIWIKLHVQLLESLSCFANIEKTYLSELYVHSPWSSHSTSKGRTATHSVNTTKAKEHMEESFLNCCLNLYFCTHWKTATWVCKFLNGIVWRLMNSMYSYCDKVDRGVNTMSGY